MALKPKADGFSGARLVQDDDKGPPAMRTLLRGKQDHVAGREMDRVFFAVGTDHQVQLWLDGDKVVFGYGVRQFAHARSSTDSPKSVCPVSNNNLTCCRPSPGSSRIRPSNLTSGRQMRRELLRFVAPFSNLPLHDSVALASRLF